MHPLGVALGSDSFLWSPALNNFLVQMGNTGSITIYGYGSGVSNEGGIASESGYIWMTGSYNGIPAILEVNVFSPTAVQVNNIPSTCTDITAGPDGALWCVAPGANQVIRMTTSGSYSTVGLPSTGSQPTSIASGNDGYLWVTSGTHLLRVSTSGSVNDYAMDAGNCCATSVSAGGSGLWVTNSALGFAAYDGNSEELTYPDNPGTPAWGTLAASDGTAWFLDLTTKSLVHALVPAAPTPSPSPTPVPTPTPTPTPGPLHVWPTPGPGTEIDYPRAGRMLSGFGCTNDNQPNVPGLDTAIDPDLVVGDNAKLSTNNEGCELWNDSAVDMTVNPSIHVHQKNYFGDFTVKNEAACNGALKVYGWRNGNNSGPDAYLILGGSPSVLPTTTCNIEIHGYGSSMITVSIRPGT